MKYTTDQLELIAILFKIQFSDKTVGDFFPNHWNELEKKITLGEMETEVSLLYRDINFNHFSPVQNNFLFKIIEEKNRIIGISIVEKNRIKITA